jgi:dolichyl-phosphate-mannose-protein mannosyltransferase
MADKKAAVASGADPAGDALRRRNVPGSPGAAPQQPEVDDKKLQGKKKQSGVIQFLDEWEFLIAPFIFTALAFFTRLWKIGLSNIVTWDVSGNDPSRLPMCLDRMLTTS